jgi:hypothetical protein
MLNLVYLCRDVGFCVVRVNAEIGGTEYVVLSGQVGICMKPDGDRFGSAVIFYSMGPTRTVTHT